MTFTPLVSPAVTPLDTQFQFPEFAVPGEYFSPLTSPALEAQNAANHQPIYGPLPRSDTSDTTSPIDMNIDCGAPTSASGSSSVRKSKKRNTSTAKTPNRTVRQSPSMKPQSKKKTVSATIIPPKEISDIMQNAQKSTKPLSLSPSSATLGLPYNQDSSDAGSISPEPSSDILMPPPATPRSSSSSRSPYLPAKQSGLQSLTGEPATPASLMKICKPNGQCCSIPQQHPCSDKQSGEAHRMDQVMEDIALPEPAKPSMKPILTPLDTSNANLGRTATSATVRKVTRIGPLSSPPTATTSLFPSPHIPGATSPSSCLSHKRADSRLGGRENKKRNTSVQVSPALRPKMSPHIKPLLPEGGKEPSSVVAQTGRLTRVVAIVTAETSALLLASKSNYQNILEGTHLPGVSYPEALSTNLTSKRTSHKIAEQGRRNRINTALHEIASLLPSATPPSNGTNGVSGNEGGSAEGSSGAPSSIMAGNAAQQSNSKASTVELAIEYIKNLQAELRSVQGKLDAAEKELGRRHEKTHEA
jgi:hypothetical protein